MCRAENDGATDAIGDIPSGEDARGDAVALALRWLRADDVDIADENISVALCQKKMHLDLRKHHNENC